MSRLVSLDANSVSSLSARTQFRLSRRELSLVSLDADSVPSLSPRTTVSSLSTRIQSRLVSQQERASQRESPATQELAEQQPPPSPHTKKPQHLPHRYGPSKGVIRKIILSGDGNCAFSGLGVGLVAVGRGSKLLEYLEKFLGPGEALEILKVVKDFVKGKIKRIAFRYGLWVIVAVRAMAGRWTLGTTVGEEDLEEIGKRLGLRIRAWAADPLEHEDFGYEDHGEKNPETPIVEMVWEAANVEKPADHFNLILRD